MCWRTNCPGQISAFPRSGACSIGGGHGICPVVASNAGPLCNSREHQMPGICVPLASPSGSGSGRSVNEYEGLEAYVYPPSQLLSRILQKFALAHHCRLIVIAPWWPAMSWFPLLLEWSICPPIRLPVSHKMLKQPRSNVFHQNPQILDLHAWRLEKSA